MEKQLTAIIYVSIVGIVVVAVLLGLRSAVLKNAYDASASFTVTDSNGTVHTIAASGLSGDTSATLYGLATGLVIIAVVLTDILLIVGMVKGHKA